LFVSDGHEEAEARQFHRLQVVKAVWRAFGGGSGLCQVIWFVNRAKYKTLPNGLQDLRRERR
jgi:hypothetical protein